MFAESVDVVIGVDSHRDSHALALVDAGLGALIAEERVEANREGYQRALKLAAVAVSVGSGQSRAPLPTEPVSLVIYSSGASGCSNSSGRPAAVAAAAPRAMRSMRCALPGSR